MAEVGLGLFCNSGLKRILRGHHRSVPALTLQKIESEKKEKEKSMDGIPKGTRESTTLNIYKFALNHVFTGLKSKASIINCPTKRATCGRVNIKQNLFWSFNWSNSGQLKCENKT